MSLNPSKRNSSTLRVLYLHGLEETIVSPKPACLINDKELDTLCPELGIYFTKVNSPVISLLCAPSFGALVASSVVLALAVNNLAGASTGMSFLAALVFFGGMGFLGRKALLAQALAHSFKASVAVAKSALRQHNPDVVVGFSWGKFFLRHPRVC